MQTITVEEVKEKLQNNEEICLLDVRQPEERDEFHIGGRHLPLSKIMNFETDTIEDWKDKEVVLYCRSGKRSMQAGVFLEQQGFAHVKNLSGGIVDWQKES